MMEGKINRDRLKLLSQLGPGVFWLVFFFVIPILLILTYSFYQFSDGVMQKTFTMENYIRAVTQHLYFKIFTKSLWYGVVVTSLCLLIGYPCAYFLARTKYKRKEMLFLALIVPFWTSIVVRTYAWKVLLGTNGLINHFLFELGSAAFGGSRPGPGGQPDKDIFMDQSAAFTAWNQHRLPAGVYSDRGFIHYAGPVGRPQ
jgi:ABC-type spermidine/putrescine transport system permease subunit I